MLLLFVGWRQQKNEKKKKRKNTKKSVLRHHGNVQSTSPFGVPGLETNGCNV